MKLIDMVNDPRRAQFDYFRTFANPYVGVTVNCDITDLRRLTQERGCPFFLTVLYCAVRAANAVPELRRRLHGEDVVEYDRCLSSHTVALPDGSYCYCELDCEKPFAEFLPYALERVEAAKNTSSLDDGDDAERLFFVTCVPWLSFSAIRLPTPSPADSNVRLTFGKFFEQEGKILLPVDLTAHHALVDGLHIARFFDNFSRQIAALKEAAL